MDSPSIQSESTLKVIEAFILTVFESLSSCTDLDLRLPSWKKSGGERKACFLSPKYLRIIYTVVTIYINLLEGRSVNQRQLYYGNKLTDSTDTASFGGFRSSPQAALTVQECCALLGVSRPDLQVVGTARGLVAGYVSVRRSSKCGDEWVNVADLDGNFRIDSSFLALRTRSRHPSEWLKVCPPCGQSLTAMPVLLFEKDAVFQEFFRSGRWRSAWPCIMVTGCGVPDTPTRALLSALGELGCRIIGFVDYNPSGLMIFATYLRGSSLTGARHFAGRDSHGGIGLLEIPHALLGGLCARDVLFVDDGQKELFSARDGSVLCSLTARCADGAYAHCAGGGALYEELQSMAVSERKVELGAEVWVPVCYGWDVCRWWGLDTVVVAHLRALVDHGMGALLVSRIGSFCVP